MRKLLSLLLACMLFFASASAEQIRLNVELDMPDAALVRLLNTLGGAFPDMAQAGSALTDSQWKGIAKLIDGLGFAVNVNADSSAGEIILQMGGTTMLDAGFDTLQGMNRVVFDWLPEVYFELPAAQEASTSGMLVEDEAVAAAMESCVLDWYDALSGWTEEGAFAGAAYTAGIYRTTTFFDDRDLYLFLEDVLHYSEELAPLRKAVIDQLGADVLEQVRARAFQAAKENLYSYTLHVVDDGYNTVGITLLAELDGAQIASLSVGFPEKGFKAVLGYGYQGGNVYLTAESSDGVSGTAAMVKDDALQGLYTASRSADNRLLEAQWKMTSASDQSSLDATLTGALMKGVQLRLTSFADLGKTSGEQTIRLFVNEDELLTVRLSGELADETLAPLDVQGMRAVRMNEDGYFDIDGEMLSELGVTFGVRLFKALPAELLVTMMNMPSLFE